MSDLTVSRYLNGKPITKEELKDIVVRDKAAVSIVTKARDRLAAVEQSNRL